MSDEELNAAEETETTEEAPKKRFSLGSKKVKVLILLVVVMGVQLAGLYLFLPSSTATTNASEDEEDLNSVETVEVTIDNFVVYNGIAAPGRKLSINFKLTAAVSLDQEVEFDQAANNSQKEQIRAAVGEVIGDSSLEELNDPRRSVIRRKLKERINKELGKSYVQRIYLSGFQVIEN